MKPRRRKFLHLAAGVAAFPAMPGYACAQAYPTRPVRIIVGFPPGTAPDIIARLMGQWCRNDSANNSSSRTGRAPRQCRHRNGREVRRRTAHAAHGCRANAINAGLYEPQFQFHPRHPPVASIGRHALCHGRHSVVPGQNRSRAHRLCQGQSGQDQHGIGRQQERPPYLGGLPGDGGSIWSTCRIVAVTGPICSAGRCRWCLVRCLRRLPISKQRSCGRWRLRPRRDGKGCRTCRAWPKSWPGYDVSLWFGIGAPKGMPTGVHRYT